MKKLICAVTVLAVSTAQADTIYVDADNCPGPGNGSEAEPSCRGGGWPCIHVALAHSR